MLRYLLGGNVGPQDFATLGQLRLVAGEAWESPANMLSWAPSSWRAPREVLYVLLALDGPPLVREPLEGAAVEALVDEFSSYADRFAARGSVTARLRGGIEAANRLVDRENERAFPQGRRQGGVICLLLRGEEAYLAQIGPPRAYLCRAGEVRGYAPWEPEALLGQRKRVPVRLSHFPLAAETRILLTDRQWEESALEEARAKLDAEAVWESVASLAPTADSSTWLIGPASEASREAGLRREVYESAQGVSPQDRQVMHAAQLGAQVQLRQPDQPAAPLRQILQVGKGLGMWISRVGRYVGEAILPRPLPAPREHREPRPQLSTLLEPYLPLIALGIPLLMLLLTGLIYWQTKVEGGTEFAAYLRQAREALSIAAQSDTDQAADRVYLRSALDQIDAALNIRPGREEAQKLREEVQRQLDLLNRVTRLAFIHTLYEYPPQSRPGRVLQVGNVIYVLDRGADEVYQHRLEGSGQSLVEDSTVVFLHQGQEVEGQQVAPLADMAWLPTDEEGRLLILDRDGTLWTYTPDGEVQPLALPELGAGSEAGRRMASYKGRLYVLAPGRDQVLRYSATENGFAEPESYFPPGAEVDLSGVRDMAIDGYIYLLWGDGLVLRFLGGEERPLPISLPDAPLGQTPALFARPDEEAAYLYLLDAAQQRVVQLTKDGKLVRQLRSQDPAFFTDLHGLFVDEAQGRLLVPRLADRFVKPGLGVYQGSKS